MGIDWLFIEGCVVFILAVAPFLYYLFNQR